MSRPDSDRLTEARRKIDDAIDALDALDNPSSLTTIAIVLLTGARILTRASLEECDEEGA